MKKNDEMKESVEENKEFIKEVKSKVVNSKVVNETKIYIGPTIQGIVVHATVYNNGIPSNLENAIKDTPEIGGLLVPIDKLPNALGEIGKKQGSTYILYQRVAQFKAKKGE